jgi:hypothetical protein
VTLLFKLESAAGDSARFVRMIGDDHERRTVGRNIGEDSLSWRDNAVHCAGVGEAEMAECAAFIN